MPSWAIDVVRNHLLILSEEGVTLAQLLSKQTTRTKVKSFAPVFAKERIMKSYSFSIYGCLAKYERELLYQKRMEVGLENVKSTIWLIPKIINYLKEDVTHFCLLTDPHLDIDLIMEENLPYYNYKNEFYLYLSGQHSKRIIENVFYTILSDRFFCVFTKSNRVQSHQVGLNQLKQWAEAAKTIAVFAYDGESYMLWE